MKPYVILVAFLALPSCGGGSILPSLRARAAFELDCPKESLSIEPLGNWSVKGVRGCGQKVVYVYIGGQWLRNSEGQNAVVRAALIEEQRREEEERRKEEERRRKEEEDRREWEEFRRKHREAVNATP
jgi:hypothetical protein